MGISCIVVVVESRLVLLLLLLLVRTSNVSNSFNRSEYVTLLLAIEVTVAVVVALIVMPILEEESRGRILPVAKNEISVC